MAGIAPLNPPSPKPRLTPDNWRLSMAVNEQIQQGMLTPQQLAFYDAFGFLVVRQAFSHDEMRVIEIDHETIMLEDRHGKPFDGRKSQNVIDTIEHQPGFRQIMENDRIAGSVGQIMGPDFVYLGSDSHFYVGDTHWHPDMGWHPSMFGGGKQPPLTSTLPGIKVAFYLDPVTCDTGCLRVIPGSHLMLAGGSASDSPVLNPFQDYLGVIHCDRPENFTADGRIQKFGLESRDIPSYPLESESGDVVFFNHRTWHASFGGAANRRMIALNYKAKPITEIHKRYIRDTLENMTYTN